MNVHFVSGDILLSKTDAIGHGTNARGVLGAGLAKSLADKYPALAADYRQACRRDHLGPGDVNVWPGPPIVINFVTQSGFNGARLVYVESAFGNFRSLFDRGEIPIRTLALPKIAAGLGGLSWDTVLPVILRTVRDLPIHVYIYTHYRPGVGS